MLGDGQTIISITEELLLQKKLPMLENIEEIMNVDLKSRLLPQGKNVEAKHRGNVVRRMRVRRKAIFPASVKER